MIVVQIPQDTNVHYIFPSVQTGSLDGVSSLGTYTNIFPAGALEVFRGGESLNSARETQASTCCVPKSKPFALLTRKLQKKFESGGETTIAPSLGVWLKLQVEPITYLFTNDLNFSFCVITKIDTKVWVNSASLEKK